MRESRSLVSVALGIVIVVVIAIPLATADMHGIVDGNQGPKSRTATWDYVPQADGNWSGHVVNSGLRWLVVNVYDNSSGTPDEIMHQRIRFAAYDAFPNGEVDTQTIAMSPEHRYVIEAIPNGPRGSTYDIDDNFDAAIPPNAAFATVVGACPDHMIVYVDASSSSDSDGAIVSYDWAFGDGEVASGQTASHVYSESGIFTIQLVLTDDDGLTNSTSESVDIVDMPPKASFELTYASDGRSIGVDASGSWDDFGIVNYVWSWGDFSVNSTGIVTNHTYQYNGSRPYHYAVSLAVYDAGGQSNWSRKTISIPPLLRARFTCHVVGSTVEVNASISDAYAGIVSCVWDWGDGSPPYASSSLVASHAYDMAPESVISWTGDYVGGIPPRFPYNVIGYAYAPDGTSVSACNIVIWNVRTGEFVLSDTYDGYFSADMNNQVPAGIEDGDLIRVVAWNETSIGWIEGLADTIDSGYLWLDVVLSSPGTVVTNTITLTISDTSGQTSAVNHPVVWIM